MSHLAPCPSCHRHVLIEESVCPFCAILLPPSFRGQAAPPPLRSRMGRAALLAAGATLMAAGACSSQEDPKGDAAPDGQTISDASGSGGGGGATGSGGAGGADASATGAGGSASTDAADDRGAVALYGAVSPDATIAPAYGIPGPTNS